MRYLALLLTLVAMPTLAADDIDIENKTGNAPYTCGRLESSGSFTVLSTHAQEYTALEACLNRAADGKRYRVRASLDREVSRVIASAVPAPQPTPPAPAGTANLSWTAPTQNIDGSPLTDLAGFRVYHGNSANALTDVTQLPSSSVTTYVYSQLAQGAHYFAVAAYNTSGVESTLSGVGSKTIP